MIRKATIAGVIFSLIACVRLAHGQSPSLELQISIARAKSSPAGEATRPLPVTKTPPAALDAEFEPTPMEGVTAGLNALGPLANRRLVVYGSGRDARWEITAARREPTLTVVGIEIDPATAESARRYVEHAGLSDRVTIITGDATKKSIRADIGAAYLWPETLAKLSPRIKPLDRFVSYAHDVPGMNLPSRGDIFVYEKPTQAQKSALNPIPASGPSRLSQGFRNPAAPTKSYAKPVAVYRGRQYSGPVCNKRNCSMCNAIRRQLSQQTVVYREAAKPVASAQPAGRWVMQKQCQIVNGRKQCSMQRVWQAY